MPRQRKVPIKDLFLAGQLAGLALQLNTDALEKYLDVTGDDLFHYRAQTQAAINFAKALRQQPTQHAN